MRQASQKNGIWKAAAPVDTKIRANQETERPRDEETIKLTTCCPKETCGSLTPSCLLTTAFCLLNGADRHFGGRTRQIKNPDPARIRTGVFVYDSGEIYFRARRRAA